MGVCVRYIDPNTLERKYHLLAARRMKGSHTYDKIAKILNEINTEYKIEDKILSTTTDNASNFDKAFR